MKINSISPERPIFASNPQVQQGGVSAGEAETLLQPKTQLLLENQVNSLLGELTKLLEQQTASISKLPPDIASETNKILQQPFIGEQILPDGLTALYRGQRGVVQNLTAFAGMLEDVSWLMQELPRGLPDSLNAVLNGFQEQTAKYGADLGKNILLLAQKLVDNPNTIIDPPVVLAQTARSLLDSMPRQELTIARQEIATKLPELLNNLSDDFARELSPLTTRQGKEMLLSSLRESVKQLLNNPQSAGNPYTGLPSLLDDLISMFETKLNNVFPQLEGNIIVGNLRQLCQQLLQELTTADEESFTQILTKMQEKVPNAVIIASAQQYMPELNQAWILQRLETGRRWLKFSPAVLHQAAQNLRELASAIQRTVDLPVESTAGQNSASFLLPLYLGEEKRAYPAYIHIYQDKEGRNGMTEGGVRETWFRICLATENIGVVDMIFHIFGQNQLSIRVNFSDINIAEKFKDNISEIRTKLEDTALTINDFSVNTV